MKTTALLLSVGLLATPLLSGCGRSNASTPSAATTRATTGPAASSRVITLTANDTMRFNTTQIFARPGEPLAIELTNEGTIPKVAMAHNWVLLSPDTDLLAFAQDGACAAATNYISEAFQTKVLAATKLLGPKETETVRLNAPRTPGHYPFICSFPGHMQLGMKGELIVE